MHGTSANPSRTYALLPSITYTHRLQRAVGATHRPGVESCSVAPAFPMHSLYRNTTWQQGGRETPSTNIGLWTMLGMRPLVLGSSNVVGVHLSGPMGLTGLLFPSGTCSTPLSVRCGDVYVCGWVLWRRCAWRAVGRGGLSHCRGPCVVRVLQQAPAMFWNSETAEKRNRRSPRLQQESDVRLTPRVSNLYTLVNISTCLTA